MESLKYYNVVGKSYLPIAAAPVTARDISQTKNTAFPQNLDCKRELDASV